jgi:hypothetical protein
MRKGPDKKKKKKGGLLDRTLAINSARADATGFGRFKNEGANLESFVDAGVRGVGNFLKESFIDTAESLRDVGRDLATGASSTAGVGEPSRDSGLLDLIDVATMFIPVATGAKAGRRVFKTSAVAMGSARRTNGRLVPITDHLVSKEAKTFGANVTDETLDGIENSRKLMADMFSGTTKETGRRAENLGLAAGSHYGSGAADAVNSASIHVTEGLGTKADVKAAKKIWKEEFKRRGRLQKVLTGEAKRENDEAILVLDAARYAIERNPKAFSVPLGKLPFVGVNKTPGKSVGSSVIFHELTHSAQKQYILRGGSSQRAALDLFEHDMKQIKNFAEKTGFPDRRFVLESMDRYYLLPQEMQARATEIRMIINGPDPKNAFRKVTKQDMEWIADAVAETKPPLGLGTTIAKRKKGHSDGTQALASMMNAYRSKVFRGANRGEELEAIRKLINALPVAGAAVGTAGTLNQQ